METINYPEQMDEAIIDCVKTMSKYIELNKKSKPKNNQNFI